MILLRFLTFNLGQDSITGAFGEHRQLLAELVHFELVKRPMSEML
jgi:hypothetical protein